MLQGLHRLAELMREGSKKSQHVVKTYVAPPREVGSGMPRACALGAAWLGFHTFDEYHDPDQLTEDLHKETGLCHHQVKVPSSCSLENCAVPTGSRMDASWTVIHLNDVHGWSREKIADYLDCAAEQEK